MDTLGCPKCKSSGHNRTATHEEAVAFWRANGVDGAAPDGLDVRSLIVCSKRINLHGDLCGHITAWVRKTPGEEWWPIVWSPNDSVAGVSG